MDPEHYQKEEIAEEYDENRFQDSNWRKKYFDIFERGCVTRWIRPGSVLDVGCGTSRFGFIQNYTGIDFSEPMLEKAREKHPDNEYIQGDAKELPFEDNSFDNVISTRLLMHIDNWEKAVEEMHRVCKPGGRIIFDVKPQGVMSILLRWRQKELKKENLHLNIVDISHFQQYNVLDTANFPKILPMTKFIVIEKEKD